MYAIIVAGSHGYIDHTLKFFFKCTLLSTHNQAKHLQFVSGVDVTSYWLATFFWDLLNALVPVFLSFILFAAFQVDGYTGDALGGIFLLLVSTILGRGVTYCIILLCYCYVPCINLFFCVFIHAFILHIKCITV